MGRVARRLVEPLLRGLEVGIQQGERRCRYQGREVQLDHPERERLGVAHPRHVEGPGVLLPTPAVGLVALVRQQREAFGEGLQVAFHRALGNGEVFGLQPFGQLLGRDLGGRPRDEPQHLPLAKEGFTVVRHL